MHIECGAGRGLGEPQAMDTRPAPGEVAFPRGSTGGWTGATNVLYASLSQPGGTHGKFDD